jgi:hypothetical protein
LILLLSWEATMMKFLADAAVLRKLHEWECWQKSKLLVALSSDSAKKPREKGHIFFCNLDGAETRSFDHISLVSL